MKIHPTSIISPDCVIEEGVEIGPYCHIQGKVTLKKGTYVEGHATIGSRNGVVIIGENNHICPGAVIGGAPQDISYRGEPTQLIIGNGNVFREFSTANLATSKGDGKTEIGDNCYFMAYTHVGHDCKIGNQVIMANDTHIGGHCEIEDGVTIGGVCAFNQFTKVGKMAFVAGSSVVNKDILPFSRARGNYAVIRATNKIGLARKGLSREEVLNIHKAIRILTMGSDTIEEGVARIQNECVESPQIQYLLEFIRKSKRGLALDRSLKGNLEEDNA